MKFSHFETLKPVCPRCRTEQASFPLKIAQIDEQTDVSIIQGLLHCTNANCQLEFPIIDGIPIIVPDLRTYLTDNLPHITDRTDLSPTITSLLGDALGPGTLYDATRMHLSSYCWSHYHDLIPGISGENEANTLVNCLNAGLALVENQNTQTILDIGCSVGRSSFELAEKTNGMVLGIDVNFSMLRLAQNLLSNAAIKFPLRRSGIVYDTIFQENISFSHSEKIDFWCCSALSLPFNNQQFDLVTSLNVFDAVTSPYELLLNKRKVLKTGGYTFFTTPFDWSTSATPLEAWVGGHSQRSQHQGSPETVLKQFLGTDKQSPMYTGLELVSDIPDLNWKLRVHDRHETTYKTHLFSAKACC